jgi:hypothetical protein
VAGYSACLTSFTSSIRFSLHAYYQSREDARKASLSGEFIVYALGLTEQAYRRLEYPFENIDNQLII